MSWEAGCQQSSSARSFSGFLSFYMQCIWTGTRFQSRHLTSWALEVLSRGQPWPSAPVHPGGTKAERWARSALPHWAADHWRPVPAMPLPLQESQELTAWSPSPTVLRSHAWRQSQLTKLTKTCSILNDFSKFINLTRKSLRKFPCG